MSRNRQRARAPVRPALLAALVLACAACAGCADEDDAPETDDGPVSELVGCDRADERVEIAAPSHLDPSCVYTRGFDVTASGASLDCRGASVHGAPGTGGRGIDVVAPEGVALEDVTIRDCRITGFLNSIRVTRTGFRDYAPGDEYLTPTANIVIEDNRFGDSHGVGLFVDGYVEDVHIRRNLVARTGSAGIYLETGSRRNRVEDNEFVDNGYVENGPGGQLTYVGDTPVWFWGVGREAIAVDGSYENVIEGNTFIGSSAGHIQLYKNCGEFPDSPRYFERRFPADANLIENNVFWGGRNGVWVGSRMAENTLPMDCTDGAYVDEPLRRVVPDYAADNTIRDNVFFDVTYAIRIEDDGTTVEGNTFHGASPDRHAVIVGTPDRTEVLGLPVDGTTLRDNASHIAGNAHPWRWIHGHTNTIEEGNTALGEPTLLCEGEDPPRQSFIFMIAASAPGPGNTAPETTPDLTVPVLGELPPCSAP